jgi:hypothetical protein
MPILRIPGYSVVNIVITQAAWLVAVLAGARGSWWPGVAAVGAVVAVHLLASGHPRTEALRLIAAAVLGFAVDALLGSTGACSWSGGAAGGRIPPPWLTALWPNFATMLTAGLAWLVPRWRLAVAFGALGGPLAYLAGARLDAVAFPHGTAIGLVAIGLCWAVAMVPLLLHARSGQVPHA